MDQKGVRGAVEKVRIPVVPDLIGNPVVSIMFQLHSK